MMRVLAAFLSPQTAHDIQERWTVAANETSPTIKLFSYSNKIYR